MPAVAGDELLLLKHSCTIVQEIADFFASDDARAQRARKKLEKRQKDGAKGKDSAAFYANISVDIQTLGEILHGFADTWSDGQGPGTSAVRHLLQTIEDEFLVKERLVKDNDSEDGVDASEEEDEEDSQVG